MILQKLRDHARRLDDELPPPMYQETPIKWWIDIGEGDHPRFVETSGQEKSQNRGVRRYAPHIKRTSGIRPKLLADTAEYVLGVARQASKPDRVATAHQEFVALTRQCAEETGEPAVKAVARFLANWDPNSEKSMFLLPDGLDGSDTVSFRVNGKAPIDLPSVRRFWVRHVSESSGDAPKLTCIICGEVTTAAKRLPVDLKGIPEGQSSGVALFSANASAFESYGREASLISPTCHECGETVANVINHLIATSSVYLGPVVYVFWTRQSSPQPVMNLLDRPDPGTVRELLRSVHTGQDYTFINADEFYAVGFSASGGRAVIRSYIETTVGTVKANLARWFQLLKIVSPRGDEGRPLGLCPLVASLYRKPSKELSAQVSVSVAQAALAGGPLPRSLLQLAVRRNRAERDITYNRAALIKAVLTSNERSSLMEELDTLNPDLQEPAYHCGRLLAELEAIQRLAIPGLNTTLVDRFYGSASTAPASVFGTLLRGAQANLAKLRKSQETKGAYVNLERRLEEIMAALPDGFPATLKLNEQAFFSLGYYHQKAHDRAEAKRRGDAQKQKEE